MPDHRLASLAILVLLGLVTSGCGPASPPADPGAPRPSNTAARAASASALPANLRCFGVEPFWSIDPAVAGPRTLSRAGEGPVAVTLGAAVHHPADATWSVEGNDVQGKPLAITIARGNCSDGMSDLLHPYSVTLSYDPLGERRGCCRLADGGAM